MKKPEKNLKIQELLEETLKEELQRYECIKNRQAFCPVPPNHIYVEPTNKCFLKCVMCTDKEIRGKPGEMSFSLWKKILDSIAKYKIKSPVNLIGRGEPLMNRNLPKFVEYATSKGVETAIISNGVMLDEKYATALLKAGIKKIQFSIHAFSRETYFKITGVDVYDKVKKNMLNLIKLNKKFGGKCYINVMSVESHINKHESADFLKYWSPRVDRAFVTPIYSIQGSSKMATESIESIEKKSGVKIGKTKHKGCAYPWFFLSFRQDGTINPCPYDFKTTFNVGNANDRGYDLMKVWNSKEMQKFRQNHLDGEYSYCKSVNYTCEECEVPLALHTYKGLDQYVNDFNVVFSREFAPILKAAVKSEDKSPK